MPDRTKNTLMDLNDYLFMEIERLSDEDLQDKELDKELQRAKGITAVADKIINNANIVLEAQRISLQYGLDKKDIPRLISDTKE